ncbi:hypothetical protein J2Y63_004898 [Shinella sp. BE166]
MGALSQNPKPTANLIQMYFHFYNSKMTGVNVHAAEAAYSLECTEGVAGSRCIAGRR